MTISFVTAQPIFDEILAATTNHLESGAVLLVSVVTYGESTRLLARELYWVPIDEYLERSEDEFRVSSNGYMQALARAEEIGATAIWFHTHPGPNAVPEPSERDEAVDKLLAPVFRMRTGMQYYGTIIASPRDSGIAFSGRFHDQSNIYKIDSILVVGDRFRYICAHGHGIAPSLVEFDRNIRAFGAELQHTLSNLRIGIVGCGGTGSGVAEILARLGVRNFLLVDPDTLSPSNVSRVFGSYEGDVGIPKVEITRRNIEKISSTVSAATVQSSINVQAVAVSLSSCDIIFGCTDDNAGRLVLSRLSTYMLIPVIDCGVLLSSGMDGALEGINGRVTVLSPGAACLICRNRIDLRRAASELLTPNERLRLEDEGYAPALGRIEPAVVTFTSAVAAAAVNEMLERFIGYGPNPRPSEMLVRFHEREFSTNMALPNPNHYCDPLAGKLGRGVTEPFLEQAWAS